MVDDNKALPGEELLKDSLESFFDQISKPTRIIYILLLIIVIGAIATVFLIDVPINLYARGITKPIIEPLSLKSAMNARVKEIRKGEGDEVNKGETIIILDTRNIELEILRDKEILLLLERYVGDLESLMKDTGFIPLSEKYAALRDAYHEKLEAFRTEELFITENHAKISLLHNYKLISDKEFNDSKHLLEKLKHDIKVYQKQQYSNWADDLSQYQRELEPLRSKIKENYVQIEKGQIKSSLKGRIQNLRGFQSGDYIFEGQDICLIIPDTTLIGEILLNSKDFRWVHEGMKIRLLMDSYNYQYWGSVDGEFGKLPADISNLNGEVFYRVRCKLTITEDKYVNNLMYLSSGMPFTAQMNVGNIKLRYLLGQKFNNLIGPAYQSFNP